jgi:hypothetical protein
VQTAALNFARANKRSSKGSRHGYPEPRIANGVTGNLDLPFFECAPLTKCMLDSAGPLQEKVLSVQSADALIREDER